MEQFEFIGYVADDAKVIPNNGHPFISFCVAVSRKFKNQQGDTVERTKWIDCTRNGDEKFAKYLKKGQQVFIRGDVDARAYIDKDNKPQGALTCHVWDTQLLAKPKDVDVPF
jgi:single-strand DNA-binding protein